MFHVTHLLGRVVSGLSDEKEFKSFICDGSMWLLPVRYRDPQLIGCGTYGQVCSVMDTLTKKQVVIKRLYRAFETQVYSRRTHRELILLSHMNHENVVGLLDAYTPDICAQTLSDVYLVTDHMSCTLQHFIAAQPNISTETIRLFVYQIFRGLKYIHSVGVIHRDLKPSNIVVDSEYNLKIIDFGLARAATNAAMTGYVATRWYRAPEVMFHWEHYGDSGKLDVWSVGCIMAQLFIGKPLFGGGDSLDQIRLIVDFLGTPSDEFLLTLEEAARDFLQSLPVATKTNFRDFFHRADDDALDLLDQMLRLSIRDRISASEALRHHYFSFWHSGEAEKIRHPGNLFCDPLEDQSLSVEEFKHVIFNYLQKIWRWKVENPQLPCWQGNLRMGGIDCT